MKYGDFCHEILVLSFDMLPLQIFFCFAMLHVMSRSDPRCLLFFHAPSLLLMLIVNSSVLLVFMLSLRACSLVGTSCFCFLFLSGQIAPIQLISSAYCRSMSKSWFGVYERSYGCNGRSLSVVEIHQRAPSLSKV